MLGTWQPLARFPVPDRLAAHGEPFGKVLEDAGFDFYAIDPLLFSPAQIRLTSAGSGRSFEAGRVDLGVLERSFWG